MIKTNEKICLQKQDNFEIKEISKLNHKDYKDVIKILFMKNLK